MELRSAVSVLAFVLPFVSFLVAHFTVFHNPHHLLAVLTTTLSRGHKGAESGSPQSSPLHPGAGISTNYQKAYKTSHGDTNSNLLEGLVT